MRRVACLALAWLVASCGQLRPAAPLALMPAPDAYEATRDAVAALNEAAGETFAAIGVKPGETLWVYARCEESRPGEIMLSPSCESVAVGDMAVELIHAIGHQLLGPGHSADPDSIMFARFYAMPLDQAAGSLIAEYRR